MTVVAEFVTSAAGAGDFPRDRLREVALVGRSNVGKSSLINSLVRRTIARTSAAPGKTRLANVYRVRRAAAPAFYLVDLPGYGYARGGDESAREFNRLTEAYFARAAAITVLLLVDARHPGLESDLDAWRWLQARPCDRAVVGTKADKLTRAERARHSRELESLFDVPVPLVSAQTGEGLDELWKLIAKTPSRRTAP
ncbi:MAG: ribosome biogenesis GTP-binding protein YsxC [Acidobacteria bacterium RIFCSPLOWO2_12_FULL_67_14]|nr:MAG: ribosome biogenesis GTP-binding protein YsxC [Acidobacteria bacterium RIFCSPLOWO2_02_FULL_67_21]OFW36778.1 MAG: ribosome biogenesis GTP-binding protein YsxC [Acidobacteria bacterium RIFCSPLOWO2_12_FULL_67_14]